MVAQDILGNFYACAPGDTGMHFLSRRTPEYAFLAPSFTAFLVSLEARGLDLEAWISELSFEPYAWGV